jgi:hypothetical protein
MPRNFEPLSRIHHGRQSHCSGSRQEVRLADVFGKKGVRLLTQDGNPIDGNALRHCLISRRRHIAAAVVRAITRNVDDTSVSLKATAGEMGYGEVDGRADRGAVGE